MKYNYLKIAKILKEKRVESGMSKRQLGNLIGVSDTEISRIENGERVNYNLINLINMCEILDIDFNNLLVNCGYLEQEKIYTYEIIVRKYDEEYYKVNGRNEEDAIDILTDFLVKNHKINSKNQDKIDFFIRESEEQNEEKITSVSCPFLCEN